MRAGAELNRVRQRLQLDAHEVWIAYFALGGTATPREVATYLDGDGALDAGQHDVLAHALNECAAERDRNHPAPYSEQLRS